MKQFVRRFGWTGTWLALSFGSRAAVGLTISSLIYAKLAPSQAAGLFQLFFLQSVFIAFVSASGFVRSVKHSHEGGDAAVHFRYYASFITRSAAIAAIASIILLPANYLGVSFSEQLAVCLLLVFGGAATALSGVLQGSVVLVAGKARTIGCVAGANMVAFVGAGFILLIPGSVTATVALFLSQLLSGVALLIFIPKARALVRESRHKRLERKGDSILLTGLANTGSLLAFFAAREYWKNYVSFEDAAFIFFIIRISDMLLQLAYFIFSSTPRLVKLFVVLLNRLEIVVPVLVILGLIGPLFLSVDVSSPANQETFVIVVLFELVILLPRAIASMSLVRLLYRDGPLHYIVTITISIAVLGGVFLFSTPPGLLTLQFAAWAMAFSIIVATVVSHQLGDKRDEADHRLA